MNQDAHWENELKGNMPNKCPLYKVYMDVSENSGTPKSSILTGFSIIFTIHFIGYPNHPTTWKTAVACNVHRLKTGDSYV